MTGFIGARTPRLEDGPLLAGRARFLDDIELPGLLHAAFLRSAQAHAAVVRVDAAAARALPGIVAVLTMEDLAPVLPHQRMPLGAAPTKATTPVTPYVLSGREVAFVGEAVAMVVAESRHLAEDAIGMIEVGYEPLPAVVDARLAIEPASVTVRREAKSNVLNTMRVAYGDLDAAFAGAPHVIHEDLWQHRGCGHPMETRGVIAEWRGDGALNVWSSTQMANEVFNVIIDAMGLDENKLHVLTPDVGGGFGPKYCVYPEEIAVPAAAALLRRPIKWVEDRRENCISAVQERDQFWSLDMAFEEDGRIRGVRGKLIHDQGAYALKAVNLPYNSATAAPGPYIVPAYAIDVVIAMTNKVPSSSVRGAGYPQAAFAMERLMDRAAQMLGLDRAEIRRRNLIPPEKMPYKKPLTARSGAAIIYDSGDYVECQRAALAAVDWEGFPQRQREARAEGRYIGIGLANAVKGTGRGPFESGSVRVNGSGRVSVFTGAAAMGQGVGTALAQICADQLGVKPEDVSVVTGDTMASPIGLGGFASRQLVTAGSSVLIASREVAQKAIKLASHLLEEDEANLELKEGFVKVVGQSNRSVTLGELARVLRGAPGYAFPPGLDPSLESRTVWQTEALAYANACHVAEVEVDVELCAVRVVRYLALQDCGTLINPMIVEGQIRGGVVHGIGNALFEFMAYDEAGQPLSTTFADYLLATAAELPNIETIFKETASPINPLGAKGVGEVGTIPAAAAVISAVEDALSPFGVKISQTPVTPDILYHLISDARRTGAPR
jgi:aerobic carbon-monoxide dehydrogenase large subunit